MLAKPEELSKLLSKLSNLLQIRTIQFSGFVSSPRGHITSKYYAHTHRQVHPRTIAPDIRLSNKDPVRNRVLPAPSERTNVHEYERTPGNKYEQQGLAMQRDPKSGNQRANQKQQVRTNTREIQHQKLVPGIPRNRTDTVECQYY